jgi:erythronate-4-phosphate dehydrogenase
MLHVLADENMPAVEVCLGASARVSRCKGRALTTPDLQDVDVLFVRSVTRVDAELLAGTPVRFVGTATSGTEHVDTDYLAAQGIGFSRAAGANANSVVEYVLSALVAFPLHLDKLMSGGTVGVVGQGPVGQAVAQRLRALGGQCHVYDPWLPQEQLQGSVSLAQVLACDLVCLHPELTRREPWPSYHLLGEQQLAVMGSHQLLINASRGAVVDNRALRRRLEAPNPPQVILDVWEGEPQLDIRLLEAVNLGTAHIAGYSLDGKILATRMLCEALANTQRFPLSDDAAAARDIPIYSAGSGLVGAALVSELLGQCYDLRDDDRRLRGACCSAPSVAAAFDELRRNYPERRELAGHTVENCSENQRNIVKALGCIPG